MEVKVSPQDPRNLKFLSRFHPDPLSESDPLPKYDHYGPAVWLDETGNPVFGDYCPSQVLPLIELSEQQLEELAAKIICTWGGLDLDPVYSTRHCYRDQCHNLFLYNGVHRPTQQD